MSGGGNNHLAENKAKERLTLAQAEKMELDLAARRGELLEAQGVRELWSSLATGLRSRLSLLPAALAPELAEAAVPAEVEALLDQALVEVMDDFARGGTEF